MSMLWLHYEKGWRLEDFAGHVLGRCFGRDPRDALEIARETFDRDTVAKWMAAQDDRHG